MKWQGRRESSNVEDRRGSGPGKAIGIGGGSIVLMLLVFLLSGGNLDAALNAGMGGGTQPSQNVTYQANQQDDQLKKFSATVFADLEDVWGEIFRQNNVRYVQPKMVIYSGGVNSGCGFASSDVGPFYCGADKTVYLDLSFYRQLRDKFGASGDFAFAYVIAHEVGHHVQNELGILSQVQGLQGKISQKEYNEYSVRLELQADYFAGVFARHIQKKGYLEKGDIEEAMTAAGAVGDDTIQKNMTGRVRPDTFTHGTSQQRMRWFTKGYENGTLSGGNTFKANDL